jgi:hypothetical protein
MTNCEVTANGQALLSSQLSTPILSFSTTCPRQNQLGRPVLADRNPVNAFLLNDKARFTNPLIRDIDKIL